MSDREDYTTSSGSRSNSHDTANPGNSGWMASLYSWWGGIQHLALFIIHLQSVMCKIAAKSWPFSYIAHSNPNQTGCCSVLQSFK
jgi:hypothetical protein